MKKLLLFIIVSYFHTFSFAQCNWEVDNIELYYRGGYPLILGPHYNCTIPTQNPDSSYVLYDLLDQGMVVFTTFAKSQANVWNYHQSGIMQDFYNTHGPNGDNRAMVFCRDGFEWYDALSGEPFYEEILGVPVMGNWLENMPYPVCSFSDYPIWTAGCGEGTTTKIWYICPDRMRNRTNIYPNSEELEDALDIGCDWANGSKNVSLLLSQFDQKPNCPNQHRPVNVYMSNNGLDSLKYVELGVSWAGVEQISYIWTGGLATYQMDTIDLGEIITDGTENDLSIYVKHVGWAHGFDEDTENDTLSVHLKAAVHLTDSILRLDVFPNSMGDGIAVDLYNDTDRIYCSGYHTQMDTTCPYVWGFQEYVHTYLNFNLAPYAGQCIAPSIRTQQYPAFLEDTPWYVRLYNEANDSTMLKVSYWPYIDTFTNIYVDLPLPVASVDVKDSPTMVLRPNPSNGQTQVSANLPVSGALTLNVLDVTGRALYRQEYAYLSQGSFETMLDTHDWPMGLYFVYLNTSGGQVVSRLLVLH